MKKIIIFVLGFLVLALFGGLVSRHREFRKTEKALNAARVENNSIKIESDSKLMKLKSAADEALAAIKIDLNEVRKKLNGISREAKNWKALSEERQKKIIKIKEFAEEILELNKELDDSQKQLNECQDNSIKLINLQLKAMNEQERGCAARLEQKDRSISDIQKARSMDLEKHAAEIARMEKRMKRRWFVGPVAGWGVRPDGATHWFLGIGVGLAIFRF